MLVSSEVSTTLEAGHQQVNLYLVELKQVVSHDSNLSVYLETAVLLEYCSAVNIYTSFVYIKLY